MEKTNKSNIPKTLPNFHKKPIKYDKTKIIKGTVNTGQKKTNYGSIPNKNEIFLFPKSPIDNRFSSGHNNIYFTDTQTFPGAGTYNLTNEFFLHPYQSISFTNTTERFKSDFNGIPGVGDYDIAIDDNKNKVRYNGLYRNYKFDENYNLGNLYTPTPTKYNPVKVNEDFIKKKKLNFNSYTGRNEYAGITVDSSSKDKFPGPGSYFKDKSEPIKNNKELYHKKLFQSQYSLLRMEAKNLLNKVKKKKDKSVDENIPLNFKLLNRRKNENQKIISVTETTNTYIDKNAPVPIYYIKPQDINKTKLYKDGKIPYVNFKINEERELKYIKDVLGNDNARPDIFYLNSPRWKYYNNKYQFKTPGPAYYYCDRKDI